MPGPTITWRALRPLHGSQHHAFEEVCAQLASAEPPGAGAIFVRNAAPDAGVECYWVLPTGEEWGWQAKFFTTLGDAQWRQLDESVSTALGKHPRLVRYIVCMPLDLADPRLDGKSYPMDRWREHVTKWESWAAEREMHITFTYWGAHELGNRLLKDEHRGRLWYWFGQQVFSTEWFAERLDESVANADQRYLPALNITLAIQEIFDGLARTPGFVDRFRNLQGSVRRAYEHVSRSVLDGIAPDAASALHESVAACGQALEHVRAGVAIVPLDMVQKCASAVVERARAMIEHVWEAEQQKSDTAPRTGRTHDTVQHYLHELTRDARRVAEHATSDEALLANTPGLLMVGSAGVGKTHLLCQVARERTAQGYPTILVLGEQLANGDPWKEILRALDLQCDVDEFLGALNASGQARGSRALLMIDALNEGEGRAMWERSLPGFLTRAARHPWVGIVITVRKSYEDAIVRAGAVQDRLVRVEHHGFYGAEARATMHFFAHYGIVAPTIPPLHPEFSNPLFLRLFCQALQNLGYHQLPPGLHGMTSVFTFFLDSVNAKLSRRDILDLDPADRTVQRCVERMAAVMAAAQQRWLPRNEARTLIATFDQQRGYAQSLFRHLLVEGVLAEDRFHLSNHTSQEGVRFTYEKFSDHLIARQLLDTHLDPATPAASFADGTTLAAVVADDWSAYQHKGIIEALAIQLPERIGQELPTLVPHVAEWFPVREAMIESLIWRNPTAFTDATEDYLNNFLLPHDETFSATMSALLTTATQVDHPYNARLLHRNLLRQPLPERDAWWSTYLHQEYASSDTNVITRLIEWCTIEDLRAGPRVVRHIAHALHGVSGRSCTDCRWNSSHRRSASSPPRMAWE